MAGPEGERRGQPTGSTVTTQETHTPKIRRGFFGFRTGKSENASSLAWWRRRPLSGSRYQQRDEGTEGAIVSTPGIRVLFPDIGSPVIVQEPLSQEEQPDRQHHPSPYQGYIPTDSLVIAALYESSTLSNDQEASATIASEDEPVPDLPAAPIEEWWATTSAAATLRDSDSIPESNPDTLVGGEEEVDNFPQEGQRVQMREEREQLWTWSEDANDYVPLNQRVIIYNDD